MKDSRLIAVTLALVLAGPAAAQVPTLSVERIFGSQEFALERAHLQWAEDGRHYTVVEATADGETDLYMVDVASGDSELVLRGADLVPEGGARPIRIDDYQFSSDRSKLLIATDRERIWRRSTRARFYVWDFEAKELISVSERPGPQQYAKFSPDGRRVAFVRDHDLFLSDLSTGKETALTKDGSEDIINGATDWVYEEELSLADGFRWSPDGRRIAFWRFDQKSIPPFYLIDQTQLYPELRPVRYPKAGTENSVVAIGVIELETGGVTWVDLGSDPDIYIARMDFTDVADEIWFQRLNRHQNRMELLLADVRTGQSRVITTDSDNAWVELKEPVWIGGGDHFLYISERDGYAQLYLYRRDGSLVRKLTSGDWDVLDLFGVDATSGTVYFTGTADGPLVRPLYRVGLGGDGFERISGTRGTHTANFDPTFTYYLDSYSEAGVPTTDILRTVNGEPVRTLTDNREVRERTEALDFQRPEFIKVPLTDDIELNGWLIKPPDFDSTRVYPLLVYVYGGPGSQRVRDIWDGDRYVWHQLMAQHGYLVACVDNRGTGGRGRDFKKMTYLRLGEYETQDQIAAARFFASLPYVDAARIGIWGWSYGGYMAALSVFRGNNVFKAAISVAPVTDWRLYDTIYTERYMRTPEENPTGYEQSAPLAYADRLEGEFLLVHGTGDDNVHPQNSIQLVQRLEEANKQFQFRLYPNKTHAIAGPAARTNLYTLLTEFLKANL